MYTECQHILFFTSVRLRSIIEFDYVLWNTIELDLINIKTISAYGSFKLNSSGQSLSEMEKKYKFYI